MSIIKSNLKKTFKIVLDSNQTASFTGNQFDATYTVDLTKILPDQEDFTKPYEMTFMFRSRAGTATTTLLDQSTVYTLCVDLGKGFNVISSTPSRNIVGIIPVNNDFTAYTTTVCPTFWDCKASDNDSVLIRDLTSITNIKVTVIRANDNTVFNPTNDATINTATKYVCVLSFKQL